MRFINSISSFCLMLTIFVLPAQAEPIRQDLAPKIFTSCTSGSPQTFAQTVSPNDPVSFVFESVDRHGKVRSHGYVKGGHGAMFRLLSDGSVYSNLAPGTYFLRGWSSPSPDSYGHDIDKAPRVELLFEVEFDVACTL